MKRFNIAKQGDIRHAISNRIYFNRKEHLELLKSFPQPNKNKAYILIKDFVYLTDTAGYVEQGSICLSKIQRQDLMLSTTMDSAKVNISNISNIILSIINW